MARVITRKPREKKQVVDELVVDIGDNIPEEFGELHPKFFGYYAIDHTKHKLRHGDCFVNTKKLPASASRYRMDMYVSPYSGDFENVSQIVATGTQVKSGDVARYFKDYGYPDSEAKIKIAYRRRKVNLNLAGALPNFSNVFFLLHQNPDHLSVDAGDLIVSYVPEDDNSGEAMTTLSADAIADTYGHASQIIAVDSESPLRKAGSYIELRDMLRTSFWLTGFYILKPVVAGPYGMPRRLPTNRIYSNPMPLP